MIYWWSSKSKVRKVDVEEVVIDFAFYDNRKLFGVDGCFLSPPSCSMMDVVVWWDVVIRDWTHFLARHFSILFSAQSEI